MGFGQRNELHAYNAKQLNEHYVREQKMQAEHSSIDDVLVVIVAVLVGLVYLLAGLA